MLSVGVDIATPLALSTYTDLRRSNYCLLLESNISSVSLVFFVSDFTALSDKVNKDTRGLQGSKLQLERVPICTCIQVSGLKKETSKDAIELYFEVKRRLEEIASSA